VTDLGKEEAVVVPSYVHFVAMELLKNATRALIDRYGLTNIDTVAPPIKVDMLQGKYHLVIAYYEFSNH